MDDFTNLDSFPIFKDFIRVPKDKMTLLGAPILQGQALDETLQIKVDELQKAIYRLKLLRRTITNSSKEQHQDTEAAVPS